MPVRSAAVCKAILDNGAAIADAGNGLQAFSQAVGGNITAGLVAESPEGQAFVDEFLEFQAKVINRLDSFRARAKAFCMEQPIISD